jgi:peptide/nickel transport system permease protein
VLRHARRNALLPVITVAGLLFPALLGGSVLVERVFAWPGMGSLLFDAVGRRDYWLTLGIALVVSAMTALGSLVADLLRELADPRQRPS